MTVAVTAKQFQAESSMRVKVAAAAEGGDEGMQA